jgi:hypothetical protein
MCCGLSRSSGDGGSTRAITAQAVTVHAGFTPYVWGVHAHISESVFMTPLLCFVVLLSATLIDFAHARCVVAIAERAPHRAALWSIVQWAGATVGFIIAVKVTFWVLPFEAAGLYLGTVIAVATSKDGKPVATVAEPMRSGRIPVELVTSALRKMSASTTASTATSSTWS